MCTSPMWRIPVAEFRVKFLFASDELYGYNRQNQAFFFPKSNMNRFEFILKRVESCGPSVFQKTLDEISECPCGNCDECRMSNSRQWAQRAVAESTCHEENWFITLTYDDEHLPAPYWTYSRVDGDFKLCSPLKYEDFVLFKKKLLRHLEYHMDHQGVRFLSCGEYGPTNGRPHYHAIMYNCPIPDLKVIQNVNLNGRAYTYMHSDMIEKLWGKGFVTIGAVNWETCAYVARYVLKKMAHKDELLYHKLCEQSLCVPLPPEFRYASRRPGLGRTFYEEHKDDIYRIDKVVLPNGMTLQPCKYFDNLYDLEDPELLEKLKTQRRKTQALREKNELARVRDVELYKKNKSEKFSRSIAKLKRPL